MSKTTDIIPLRLQAIAMEQASVDDEGKSNATNRYPSRFFQYRKWVSFSFFVILPTLLSIVYYGLIAADQYQTKILLSVRSSHGSVGGSVLGEILGGFTISQSSADGNLISQFITSRDAVSELDKKINLRSIYSKPSVDFIVRLGWFPVSPVPFESMVEYYRGMVDATFDSSSGLVTVSVKAFAPEDTQVIASSLIGMCENLVNSLNRRAEEDTLRLTRLEVTRAEKKLADARKRMREFRLKHREIDPTRSTGAVGEIIAKLEGEYARVSTELGELSSYMNTKSLQVETLRKRLKALEGQIAEEQQRLTGNDGAMTNLLLEYEGLELEHEIANTTYTSAIAAFEHSRIKAQQQDSYVIPIVSPYMPEEAEYPRKIRSIFSVMIGSFIMFGIARLLISGVRDHVMH
ncbi:capsular polysaccharide transport system permease protein [Gammaproteobacteria bacterium]